MRNIQGAMRVSAPDAVLVKFKAEEGTISVFQSKSPPITGEMTGYIVNRISATMHTVETEYGRYCVDAKNLEKIHDTECPCCKRRPTIH